MVRRTKWRISMSNFIMRANKFIYTSLFTKKIYQMFCKQRHIQSSLPFSLTPVHPFALSPHLYIPVYFIKYEIKSVLQIKNTLFCRKCDQCRISYKGVRQPLEQWFFPIEQRTRRKKNPFLSKNQSKNSLKIANIEDEIVQLTENCVLSIEPLCRGERDEELRAVRVGPRIRHRQNTRPGVL